MRFNYVKKTQIYQCTNPNLLNQICSLWTKPNTPNKIYWTISNKLNLQNQIYEAKCLKCQEPNIPNQIYSIKPTKLNPSNQFYQTNSRETKSTKNKTKVQYQLELSLAQFSPRLFISNAKVHDKLWFSHFNNIEIWKTQLKTFKILQNVLEFQILQKMFKYFKVQNI